MPYRPERGSPATASQHTRHSFQEHLDEVEAAFVHAAVTVAEAVDPLTRRALDGDRGAVDEAQALSIRTGAQAEAMQEDAYLLLALEAPVASDLRLVIALLRVVRNADRAASLLRHGCETIVESDTGSDRRRRGLVADLGSQAATVFGLGVRSWEEPTSIGLDDVDAADDRLDNLRDLLLATDDGQDTTPHTTIDAGLLARYYERIGDHGVAIARDGAWVATGERPRRPRSR